ncbi:MAG: cell division protein ZapE [Gammaproteobacteria bacterium]|nr:MAG: cell division protein ZapE [Gammaproteobacteria bacterium]
MTPLDYYREQCNKGQILEDEQQLMALNYFQTLFAHLLQEHKRRQRFFAAWTKPCLVQGLYVWGGVGIGKTFLMDCFYHCLPFIEKKRMHFHQFMAFIHAELKKYQGKKDPLQLIAKKIAQETMVLCFDELLVADIVDAMLLGRLFKALFSQGVCLVATSNVMPDELYKNGLQRQLFLPAIALLKQHTSVIHVPTQIDYRLRHLRRAGVFYRSQDELAQEKMEKSFAILANGEVIPENTVEINGRSIVVKKQANDVIWFDFNSICNIPRSQHDYLAIAKKYHTVFISDVPMISAKEKDIISLFIRLVDVLYDARVRVVMSSVELVEKIYQEGHMIFDYARTRSRLLEMQSEAYLTANSAYYNLNST